MVGLDFDCRWGTRFPHGFLQQRHLAAQVRNCSMALKAKMNKTKIHVPRIPNDSTYY